MESVSPNSRSMVLSAMAVTVKEYLFSAAKTFAKLAEVYRPETVKVLKSV